MSAKQLVRLAAILGVLVLLWGAAALARRREATASGDGFRLPAMTRAQVDTVLFQHAGETTVLARKDTSTWTVDGHPAAPQAISELFSAFADSSAGSELVAEQRTSHPEFGVDSAGKRVQIKGAGRTLADLIVGKRSPDFSGGYLRNADQEPTYMVRGRLVELLGRTGDDWRDKRIAKVAADSVARIEMSRGGRRYVVRRNNKNWELSTGGSADSARMGNLLTAYSSVEASGFASRAQGDSARFSTPDRRARLLRKDGTPLLTLLFDSTASGFWVRPDTSKTVYKVESWTADQLIPAERELRGK